MIAFLIYLLVFAIVAGVVWYILANIPMPPEIAWIVRLVAVVIMAIFLIWLLLSLVGGASTGFPALR